MNQVGFRRNKRHNMTHGTGMTRNKSDISTECPYHKLIACFKKFWDPL